MRFLFVFDLSEVALSILVLPILFILVLYEASLNFITHLFPFRASLLIPFQFLSIFEDQIHVFSVPPSFTPPSSFIEVQALELIVLLF
jgi:hypothetical protein